MLFTVALAKKGKSFRSSWWPPVPSSGFKGTVNMKASLVFLPEMMLHLEIGDHALFLPRAWSEPQSSLLPYRAVPSV